MIFNVKPRPVRGDMKTRKAFAFFPKRIDNVVVWLDFYNKNYRYEYFIFYGMSWELVSYTYHSRI